MEHTQRYRLVTRSNFDGIVNTALLKRLDLIEEVVYVHPREIQEGTFPLTPDDIVTNLPYVSGVHMAFDHRLDPHARSHLNEHHALYNDAASVCEVIWEYYDMEEKFGKKLYPLVEAANRSKRSDFTKEEVENPQDWTKLIFLTDPRSGLGRFHHFRISNYALMQKLPELLLENRIEEVLEDPDIQERITLCDEYRSRFVDQLQRCTRRVGNLAILDLRNETTIYPGNRFMLYTLFPQTEISMHIFPSKERGKTAFALGKSIFHQAETTDLHALLRPYGGGGHAKAATCQVDDRKADRLKASLLTELTVEKVH